MVCEFQMAKKRKANPNDRVNKKLPQKCNKKKDKEKDQI